MKDRQHSNTIRECENERFNDFRAKLEAKGVLLRRLWEAFSKDRSHPDVHCFAIVGAPKGGTIVVVDYGLDGFATYWESASNSVDDDVRRILAT